LLYISRHSEHKVLPGDTDMLVENWMNRNVVLIDANRSLLDAKRLFRKHDVRLLPVMKNGCLVGVLTQDDIMRAFGSEATNLKAHEIAFILGEIAVEEVMSKDTITIPSDFTIEETAEVLLKHNISGAPVLDSKGRIVGTISRRELFRVLITLAGFSKKGMKFALQIRDKKGSIMQVENIVRKHGGRVASILTSYEGVPAGYRTLFIKAYGVDRERLSELIEALKSKAELLYMIDRKENIRQIYKRPDEEELM